MELEKERTSARRTTLWIRSAQGDSSQLRALGSGCAAMDRVGRGDANWELQKWCLEIWTGKSCRRGRKNNAQRSDRDEDESYDTTDLYYPNGGVGAFMISIERNGG